MKIKEIDIAKSYERKCDKCGFEFNDKNTLYEYLEITKYEDEFDESYSSDKLKFCSEDCLIEYILASENVEEYEVKLINSKSEEILLKQKNIKEKVDNLFAGCMVDINSNIRVTAIDIDEECKYLLTINNKTKNSIFSKVGLLATIYRELGISR